MLLQSKETEDCPANEVFVELDSRSLQRRQGIETEMLVDMQVEDELPPLVRAQDDLDVMKTPAVSSFDVNRSYSNDGRLTLGSQMSARGMLQSLPLCGPNHSPSQANKRKKISTMWRFRKEMIIGAGADGKVFLAHDLTCNERIAVKEILISPSSNRTLVEAQEDAKKICLMKRQIDALRQLPHHPNVVRHLGAERTTCALHVMMEYVAGGSISALLSKLGAFSEKVVRVYTRNVCSALAFLHGHGVIHRDIKGANCLVGVDGTAKVCDFGCSVMKDKTGIAMGAQKGIHGTSMWMSPECIQSEKDISERTDIWSLGCTVVEMATGKPPWHEAHFTNEWAAMFHISQCGRGPPIPSHLSRQAHEFLQKCFHIDPKERPTAEECLRLPFLAEEFEVNSCRPEMQPPTPSKCNAPFLPSNPWSREASTISDYEASNYSSFNQGKGAVYDQEWGDAETAIDDDELRSIPDDTDEEAGTPSIDHGESDPKKIEVSLEIIDTFLRGNHVPRVSPAPTESSHSETTGPNEELPPHELDDEFGLGLPEPILFNVFSFLDAHALCMVSCVSKSLGEITTKGAKEILWRSLFTRAFGEVDPVQQVLRKNWKNYFRNSFSNRNVVVEDRFRVMRQRGQSERVYEALDLQTQELVVIKMEKWLSIASQVQPTRSQRVSTSGSTSQNLSGTMTATFRVPSPSRDQHSGNVRLPTLLRTPTKQKATNRHPAPPPPSLFSPSTKERRGEDSFERPPPLVVGNGQRPPLGRAGGLPTSPQKQRPPQQPQAPSGNSILSPQLSQHGSSFSRSRPLPRNARLPSPTQFSVPGQGTGRRTSSPFYRDGASPPTHFVFLQPSALFRVDSMVDQASPDRVDSSRGERDHSSGQALREPTHTSHHSVVRGHDGMNTTMALNSTILRDNLGSSRGGWHEIYDFQRTSELAPLVTAKQPQKSLLQHDYKFLRHLEALGARCVPRLLAYHDSDSGLHRNVLVTSSLGPSLNELLLFCGNQLTLRTLSLLTLRLLDALEEIHDRDVVHGNISPTNIVMGGTRQDKVHLINFAHARFFRDPRTHRPTNTSTSSVNAERAQKHNEFLSFCSTFVQKRCTAAPRDDIIALGYVLCYLFHGGLPWTKEKTLNVAELLRQKNAYLETLQRTPPIQLHYFLKSGYALRQGEVPDYRYLKSLVVRMMEEKRWVDDGTFDWSSQLSLSNAFQQQ